MLLHNGCHADIRDTQPRPARRPSGAHPHRGGRRHPRENNLSHYRQLANGVRDFWLGLELGDRWTDEQDVLAVMAERVGVNDDPEYRYGQDTIDPELTVDALDRMAARLRKAAEEASGCCSRPGTRAGCWTCTGPRPPRCARRCEIVVIPDGLRTDEGYVMQFADVAVLEHGATLWHTHSGEPMRAILTGLERAGRPLPDLVVADHGWAGYAGQHGVDSVGYADCNDPALFLAEAEGTVQVVVPLDDHVVSPVTTTR
ncbi:phosphatase [Streptomyces nogalater]